MDEKQIEKLAQELSEEELNQLASGKMDQKTKEKVAKWVGIGLGSANAIVLAGVGIAAIAGKVKHNDATHYLNPRNYFKSGSGDDSLYTSSGMGQTSREDYNNFHDPYNMDPKNPFGSGHSGED